MFKGYWLARLVIGQTRKHQGSVDQITHEPDAKDQITQEPDARDQITREPDAKDQITHEPVGLSVTQPSKRVTIIYGCRKPNIIDA